MQRPSGMFGGWFGLAADNSPLVLRQYVTPEQAALIEIDKQLAQAFSHNDFAALERLLSDDLVDTGVNSFVSTKEGDIAGLKSFPIQITSEQLRAVVYGDSGVVTGVGHGQFTFAGKAYRQSWRFTDTFHRSRDGWQLIATQQTRVPEPFVRDVEDSELQALNPEPCNAESSLKSSGFEIPSFIRFINRDTRPLKLYWINFEGKRAQERKLVPGKPSDVFTFVGHAFVLVDEEGKCSAVYRSAAEPRIAPVTISH